MVEVINLIIETLPQISISGAFPGGKRKRDTEPTRGANKKQQPKLNLYHPPRGEVLLNIGGQQVEANILLNCGSQIFLMFPRFITWWKVPKVQKDVLAAVRDFAGDVMVGAGQVFTKPGNISIGDKHESLISSKIVLVDSWLELIVPRGWWLTDH